MTTHFDSYDAMVSQVIETCGPDIRVACILGIGKPNRLINALYDEVERRTDLTLTIFTALSLNPPTASSDLEARFLTPFAERIYGKNFPRLKYADAMKAGKLPSNIHVEEFYTQPGSYLNSPQGQQNYSSLNYTEVADALATKHLNLVFQRVAEKAGEESDAGFSLSSNTDLTQDVLEQIERAGQPRPYCVAETDINLPWVGGKAVMPHGFFDAVLTVDSTRDSLFALPRQPVSDADFAIGLYASLLVKDGGTLQVGIGALADALCYGLVLRHRHNELYREIINALDATLIDSDLVKEFGGAQPFEHGVYGCSEMINEGFRVLVDEGIMKRRVIDDLAVMERINDGSATPEDQQRIEQQGKYLRGGFYLGSPEFYDWVKEQGDQPNTLEMDRIGRINTVTGSEYRLEVAQRRHARFMNICMMATPLGGAVSDTLPDGRVVSGVGGQYNFVSMAADLPEARSILMFHAARGNKEKPESNIRWSPGNVTIPRHLRDIYVTQYGIADLRYMADEECIIRMLSITDGSAVEGLKHEAVSSGKLSPEKVSSVDKQPAATPILDVEKLKQENTLDNVTDALCRFRNDGSLPDYPLGSDFTATEQRLVKALKFLKEKTSGKWSAAGFAFSALTSTAPEFHEELARMKLDKCATMKEWVFSKLLRYSLRCTHPQ